MEIDLIEGLQGKEERRASSEADHSCEARQGPRQEWQRTAYGRDTPCSPTRPALRTVNELGDKRRKMEMKRCDAVRCGAVRCGAVERKASREKSECMRDAESVGESSKLFCGEGQVESIADQRSGDFVFLAKLLLLLLHLLAISFLIGQRRVDDEALQGRKGRKGKESNPLACNIATQRSQHISRNSQSLTCVTTRTPNQRHIALPFSPFNRPLRHFAELTLSTASL